MINVVVYTETYKTTLKAVFDILTYFHGASVADKFLDRVDRIVKKICLNPYLYQAIPIDQRF